MIWCPYCGMKFNVENSYLVPAHQAESGLLSWLSWIPSEICDGTGDIPCESEEEAIASVRRYTLPQPKFWRGKPVFCAYCKRPCPCMQRDHVVPKSRGGPDEKRNIVMACPECNLGKNDRLPSEWIGDRCPPEVLAIEAEIIKHVTLKPRRKGRITNAKRLIYFIGHVEHGAIKIGVSKHPFSQLKKIQSGSPVKLTLLGAMPGISATEVHRQFAHLREWGEWFSRSQELLDYIAENCDVEVLIG